jgi:hypothetical protein
MGPLVPPDPGTTTPVEPPAPNMGLAPIPPLVGAEALLPPVNTNAAPLPPPGGGPFEKPAPPFSLEALFDPEHAIALTSGKQAAARRSRFVDRFEWSELLHPDVAHKKRFISSRLGRLRGLGDFCLTGPSGHITTEWRAERAPLLRASICPASRSLPPKRPGDPVQNLVFCFLATDVNTRTSVIFQFHNATSITAKPR